MPAAVLPAIPAASAALRYLSHPFNKPTCRHTVATAQAAALQA